LAVGVALAHDSFVNLAYSDTMSVIVLHDNDDVAVAKVAIAAGASLAPDSGIAAACDIPAMHKVALHPIATGDSIRKFNQVIGFAKRDIEAGEHVHSHNCDTGRIDADYAACSETHTTAMVPEAERRMFQGFRRASGKTGTRNYLGILTSVNCSATVARHIATTVERSGVLDDYPNVDGIVAIVNSRGCGMHGSGEGYDNQRRVLNGYAAHPNFGGVLLAGLGCEVLQVSDVMRAGNLTDSERFQHLIIQDAGGTRKAIEAGVEAVERMLPVINNDQREPSPISELTLALQCGGSDAYSGITANPALGKAVDLLVTNGGTAILSETTEIYGAEHLLTRRAISSEVADALIERIEWWKSYTARTGEVIDNNPSPGNKAGGLTTILEKSLGAQAKGGTTNLVGVYRYAEPIDTRGLVIMDSPGYDPASVTGQVASGANVICFTTGRGSAFGFKPTPSLKLATNTPLFEQQHDDMDINCGTVADGTESLEEKGEEILDRVIAMASGEQSKSEELGYGDNEFMPWVIGAVL
jgi:altronate hydrolase